MLFMHLSIKSVSNNQTKNKTKHRLRLQVVWKCVHAVNLEVILNIVEFAYSNVYAFFYLLDKNTA